MFKASKILGGVLLIAGSWMLVSPESLLGLKQLKWMYHFAFPGEVLLGILILGMAYYFLDLKVDLDNAKKMHRAHLNRLVQK